MGVGVYPEPHLPVSTIVSDEGVISSAPKRMNERPPESLLTASGEKKSPSQGWFNTSRIRSYTIVRMGLDDLREETGLNLPEMLHAVSIWTQASLGKLVAGTAT